MTPTRPKRSIAREKSRFQITAMTETAATDQAARSVELYNHGKTAVAGGDVAQAEALFREAIRLDAANARASHYLATILLRQNRRPEAETVLMEAASNRPLLDSLRLLADIFDTSNRPKQAIACYNAILQAVPADYPALIKLGEAYEKRDDKAAEAECYRRAMSVRPDSMDAVFKYADAIWNIDPADAIRVLEDLLARRNALPERVSILGFMLGRKEWFERMKRGEMPYHCARLDELFFNYASDYAKEFERSIAAICAANPDNAGIRLTHGTAKFCLKDRHAAEALWQPETQTGSIWETVRFSPSFYDEIKTFTDADLVQGLPPVETPLPPRPHAAGTLYLSCNALYFHAFALPMIVSLHERSPGTRLHMHIMDINPAGASYAADMLKKLGGDKFSLSIERPGLDGNTMPGRCYYHAIRLIRFYDLLRSLNSPLWLMDVDAVVNRDLGELFGMLQGDDVAMRIRPGRLEPWNQFNACVIGANPTPGAFAYFRQIAAYTAYFHHRDKLRWGIDQLAMYGVFADMQDRGEAPAVTLLGEREVDYNYREDGFIWCNSGIAKFRHLQRIASGATSSIVDERNKFSQVFERYWKQTQTISGGSAPPLLFK